MENSHFLLMLLYDVKGNFKVMPCYISTDWDFHPHWSLNLKGKKIIERFSNFNIWIYLMYACSLFWGNEMSLNISHVSNTPTQKWKVDKNIFESLRIENV